MRRASLRRTRPAAASQPLLSLGAACLVFAAVAAASELTPAAAPAEKADARAGQVLVERADSSCPELRSDADTESRVAIAAPGLVGELGPVPDARSPSRAELRDLQPEGDRRLRLTHPAGARLVLPAKVTSDKPRLPADPLVGQAEGELAAGFAASFLTRTTRGELRGLAGGFCVAADTDFWFVGSGAVIGQRGRLYLTNPTSAPALLDVTLSGPDGPIPVPRARGLTVAAHTQEAFPLDAWTQATSRLGVHVRVRQGRIAAALRDHQVRGLDPRGIDWVPAAAPPAQRVVLPGVPGGAGPRLLQVFAPGDSDAIVRVRLLAADGAFTPADADVLEVSAGTVSEIDLAKQLAGKEMAIELTADVPVTAGLLARTAAAPGELEDLAYTAAVSAITSSRAGVVPLTSGGPTTRTHLTLSAPRGDARVMVTPLSAVEGSGDLVTVPEGEQVTMELTPGRTGEPGALILVPQTGSGAVYAAVVIEEIGDFGRLLTVSPVRAGRFVVRVPRAVADLSTGLGQSSELLSGAPVP